MLKDTEVFKWLYFIFKRLTLTIKWSVISEKKPAAPPHAIKKTKINYYQSFWRGISWWGLIFWLVFLHSSNLLVVLYRVVQQL